MLILRKNFDSYVKMIKEIYLELYMLHIFLFSLD